MSSNRSLWSTTLGRVIGSEFEAVDRHSLLRPPATLDADVARRDVPAAVVHGHTDGLALTRHGNGRKHDDEPGVAQPVVHPAGAEHGVLHLGDEGVLGPVEGFVPVGERDLQQRAPGGDEMGLHADATVGIVEAVGPDHVDGNVGGGTPRLGRGPTGDELVLGGRDGRSVEEGHGRVSVGHRQYAFAKASLITLTA